MKSKPFENYVLALICFGILLTFLRLVFLHGLYYDEAEQAILSQKFSLGYDQQPPLYTWIIITLNKIIDNTKIVNILFRNGLILGIYFLIYTSASEIFKNKKNAVFASASLVLFVQFSIKSIFYTHTVFLLFSIALLYWIIIRLLKKPVITHYIILGIVMSIGILSKYNFIIFALSFLISAIILKPYRRYIFTPKLLISILVFLVLISPHFYWLTYHIKDSFNETMIDLQGTNNQLWHMRLWGILALITKLGLSFVAFLIFILLLLGKKIKFLISKNHTSEVKFIGYTIITSILFLLIIITVTNANDFRARWLQPVLIITPSFVFGIIDSKINIPDKISDKYIKILYLCFGAVLLFSGFKVVIASNFGIKKYNIDLPYSHFAHHLQKEERIGEKQIDLIIAMSVTTAGNMKYYFKNKPFEIMDTKCNNKYGLKLIENPKRVLLLFSLQDKEELFSCVRTKYNSNFLIEEQGEFNHFYNYSKKFNYTFSYAIITL